MESSRIQVKSKAALEFHEKGGLVGGRKGGGRRKGSSEEASEKREREARILKRLPVYLPKRPDQDQRPKDDQKNTAMPRSLSLSPSLPEPQETPHNKPANQ